MKRASFLLLSIVFTGLFLCAVSVSFSSSLWFLRALLPENSGEYTVGYKNSFVNSSSLVRGIQEKYASILPIGVGNFNRFVYTKDGQAQYIVGIPKVLHQLSLAQELRAQSYTVHRLGYILLASKGSTETSSNSFMALGKTLSAVFIHGLPISGEFILQNSNTGSESNALYIEQNSSSLHAVVHTNSSNFIRGNTKRLPEKSTQPEATFITLQKNALNVFPTEFIAAVESKVSELMHFTKTHPKTLQSLLSENESVILSIKESSVALGVVSNGEKTAGLIQSWMDAEQGTRHPQKKAFSLPDKSIGYEFIPGKSNAHFSITKGVGTTCLPTQDYDEQLFLCGKDNILVVATEEILGNQTVSFLTDSTVLKKGVIQSGALNAVGLGSEFTKIEYSTTPDSIDIWADLKTKK
ncbi:MAG: hypothetical protein AAB649_03480 [Patescibacteria group bacterium]